MGSILSFAVQATLRVRGDFDIIHNQGLCGLRSNVFTAHICNRAWHRALRHAIGNLTFREWVSGTFLSALEYLFYSNARKARIIAVSNRVARDIRQFYHSSAPVSVIYHGVDLDTFSPNASLRSEVRSACQLAPEEMVFLFVGDMRKGARQCIRALAALPSAKLLFASRSPEAPYRKLAAELGLERRVLFLGVTGQVQRYYAASDALLLPTHYDSFAMVVTEAMACALPVIVSREAGASELIQSGINGLVLENFHDSAELAEKMRLLAGNPELCVRMGAAARQTMLSHSWDQVAGRTIEVYRQLLLGERLTADLKAQHLQ